MGCTRLGALEWKAFATQEIRMTRPIAAAALVLGVASIGMPASAQVSTDPTAAPSGIYGLETAHSQLLFSVVHLGLTDYFGRFDRLSGTLNFNAAQPDRSSVTVTVDPASGATPI